MNWFSAASLRGLIGHQTAPGARNAEYAGKGDRIVAGQDRDFLPWGNAGIGESAGDPIAKALHLTIAQVVSVHGQAWRIGTERDALIQIVDKPHELPPGMKLGGAVVCATRLYQLCTVSIGFITSPKLRNWPSSSRCPNA